MSIPNLPEELLDHVVDLLRNTRDALKSCCLVSKSWVPRSRKHLFALIKFATLAELQSWKNTFPDPSTSPGCYTKSLSISYFQKFTVAEVGGWIPAFSQVVHFKMFIRGTAIGDRAVSLIPFHGFTACVKSLRISSIHCPISCISNLIDSFPLLENLFVDAYSDSPNGRLAAVQPPSPTSSPPPFTGFLKLRIREGIEPISSRLLSLSGGLHFRELDLLWNREHDVFSTSALVESCGSTLESLRIQCQISTSVRHLRIRLQLTPVRGQVIG